MSIELLFITLAVYRLATDMALEDGPFALFSRVRGAVMTRYGKDHWLSEGVGCPICLSFWLSLPVAFFYGPLVWLAVAGVVSFLARVSTR